ncbi:ferritin family protein [Ferroglobus sp.]|uniref:ferritin-like domain-containing protein n=1 Tax=Ferroglobus sp. TaxID=2614230 RepID=UPI0025BE1F4B|nr:ferritin family protein [Ferroglobus sp.]
MVEYGDNKNKIGVTKGTELEEAVNNEFRGETMEVGLYLAIARQAEREGYPEIAAILKSIAMDEAYHAARFAELNGMIKDSLKESLEYMLEGEMKANKWKREVAVKAKELGIDEAHDIWDEASRDEYRHAEALKGLLKRYFS